MKKLLVLGTITLFCVGVLYAENYYVNAVNGLNTNLGTSPDKAWQTVEKVNETVFSPGDVIHFRSGQLWRESLRCQSGIENKPLIYTSYGEGAKPLFTASMNLCIKNSWTNISNNIWCIKPEALFTTQKPDFVKDTVSVEESNRYASEKDIGNIILTKKGMTEKIAGWKRWNLEELTQMADFYHDIENDILYFYSEKNPAIIYSKIEAAQKRNVIAIHKSEHIIIDGLAAAYTGAHGVQGENSNNCVIRNCDFTWIGGGHHSTQNKKPVRYGNGIEFWNGCENILIENCYFEEIYDVAITNQGPEACLVKNMIMRGNKIYRCEQAYEIWFSNKESYLQNIIFEENECIDSGFGWSHEQRPDKSGTHILSYDIQSKVFEICYRNNIFNNAKIAMIWYFNPRLPEAHLYNNIYIQKADDCLNLPLFRWNDHHVTWQEYREITGNDENSIFSCE